MYFWMPSKIPQISEPLILHFLGLCCIGPFKVFSYFKKWQVNPRNFFRLSKMLTSFLVNKNIPQPCQLNSRKGSKNMVLLTLKGYFIFILEYCLNFKMSKHPSYKRIPPQIKNKQGWQHTKVLLLKPVENKEKNEINLIHWNVDQNLFCKWNDGRTYKQTYYMLASLFLKTRCYL